MSIERSVVDLSGTTAPTSAPRRTGQGILTWLGLVALAVAAVVGGNIFSVRDRLVGSALPAAVPPVTSRVSTATTGAKAPRPTALRSTPWWQVVTTLEGSAATTSGPFTIDRRAIQWRVTWTCSAGHLLVRGPESEPVVDGACPQGTGFSSRTGTTTLEVRADGPWRLEVAQRIDTPLVEPPLPAMTAPATATVAAGSFRKVDKTGAGRVTIFSQADGAYSVRLEDFWVTPKPSLQLRLSPTRSPHSSREYLAARSQLLAVLDVTAGSLNYVAPVGVDPAEFQSVVIWSPADNSAYAAASLAPAS